MNLEAFLVLQGKKKDLTPEAASQLQWLTMHCNK